MILVLMLEQFKIKYFSRNNNYKDYFWGYEKTIY